MEFALDDGQIELQQTVARFCAGRFPLDGVGEREQISVDRELWAAMAELGVLGIVAPEASGGFALGAVDAAIVFEQLGSHLAPGPVLWSALAAPYVDGVTGGETVVAGVEHDAIVDGRVLVADGGCADVLLVLGDDSVVAHRAPFETTALDALDPLTPVVRVTGLGPGDVVGDATAARDLRLLGSVLSAAALAGIASRALEYASAYALERHQFDAPIGSFQAVKHLLADMYVRTSLAQSATYAAAAVLDDPGSDDPIRAAAGAKLLAAEAAQANAETAIQVLGGMGFTWEMLPNYLLKRAWVHEHDFGTRKDLARQLGDLVGSPV